jgi:hypothetical protein
MKRKSSQKLTPNQMAFKKELKRIKRFVRNARKRGYEFDDNVLPKQPKRVTRKKLEEIKNIKPSNLYDKAVYRDEISQEIFTGQQGRRIERYRASLKAKKTREKNKKIRAKSKSSTGIKEKNLSSKKDKKSDESKQKKSSDKKSTETKEKKSTTTKNKKNKQSTKDNTINNGSEYYPTVDIIDEIGERLVNVDYVMKKLTDDVPNEDYRYIWKRKATANDYSPSYFYSNIWKQTIEKYEEQNALSALEEYAKDNALEITNCIDTVYWSSSKEEEGNWQRLSSKLVILLKGGEIPTLDEAQQLGELQEQNDLVSDSYED